VAATLPILVAAGVYVASDELLDWFRAYVDAGGHLIVGPRTGYADLEARARTGVHPAGLSERAGVWYAEFSNLLTPVPVRAGNGSDLHPPESAAATRWVDGLLLDGAGVLLEYDHPHFGRWPAITTRAAGTGRVTYVGTVPNPPLAQSLFAWASAGQRRTWRGLPAEVTVTAATARDGAHLSFVHNWNWQPRSLAAPVALRDVLSGQHFSVGDSIDLGPWDVRVFTDRP
jgi:beta-galactosidase